MVKKMKIKALGFDLGETLFYTSGVRLNWMEHYIPALKLSLDKLGITCSENQLQKSSQILSEYNTRINPRTKEISCDTIFKRIIEETGLPQSIELAKFEDGFFTYFSKDRQDFYEDAVPSLLKIKESGFRMGYLTDVPYGQKRLTDRNSTMILEKLLSFSSIYISSIDVGYRKPEIYGFMELANRLQCDNNEVLYIGNEEKDIVGAKNAGMVACLISREKKEICWGQDMTIHSLNDIVGILGK
jgi:putative hydrolase of the HAD superfamily